MALTQRLDLRQTQSLVMTPQLQQAIKLLQLSNLELADFVEREIEENPLLERDDGPPDVSAGDPAAEGDRGAGEDAPESSRVDGPDVDTHTLTTSEHIGDGTDGPLDADYGDIWIDGDGSGGSDWLGQWQGSGGRPGFEDEAPDIEQMVSAGITLRDHLLQQLNIALTDPADRLVGAALIDLLDDDGYLREELDAVAALLGCPPARVEQVLRTCQGFDPAGVFARSLSECLAIQLRERDRLDPAMQALLDNLDLLAARNTPALLRATGVDQEDLADMIAEIRALNPRPAAAYDRPATETVVQDIVMRPQQGGGWAVELNAETLPRVLVNQRYYATVAAGARSRKDREYLTERLTSANWLVKSLHQRANTILKVATEIVRQQDAFFRHGVEHLRPLILRDIAEAIGMHESTVSRVTTRKFMATPRGIYELKYFFTSAISGANGQASHSAEAVRYRIKALIDAERPTEVLSDDRIVEILRAGGIDIARRTVAKYREAMRIPSSVQRRREKSLRPES